MSENIPKNGEAIQGPAKRNSRKGCIRSFAVFLLIALPVYWLCIHTTPLKISKETTYITEPLSPNGKWIDYFTALEQKIEPACMKTDDNGYRVLVRSCGISSVLVNFLKNPENVSRIYEKLGLDPKEKSALKLESVDSVIFKLDEERSTDETFFSKYHSYVREHGFWMLDDFPQLETWLSENNAGLDILAQSVRKPAFCMPLLNNIPNRSSICIPVVWENTIAYREYTRAVYGRALYRIGIGDIDGAIDDIITVHLLVRHAAKQGTLLGTQVALAIEESAYSIGINANPKYPATKEQLHRFLTELDALPPFPPLKDCLETEILCNLGYTMQNIFQGNYSTEGLSHDATGKRFAFVLNTMYWSCDINLMMWQVNSFYEQVLAEKDIDQYAVFKSDWRDSILLLTVRGRSRYCSRYWIQSYCVNIINTKERYRQSEHRRNLQRLTLAVLLYEKEHGKLPNGSDWTALVPYLGERPENYSDYKLVLSDEESEPNGFVVKEKNDSSNTSYLNANGSRSGAVKIEGIRTFLTK